MQVVEIPEIKSRHRLKKKQYRKAMLIISGILGALLVTVGINLILMYPHIKTAQASVKDTLNQAKRVEEQLEAQNVIGVREQSIILQDKIEATKGQLRNFVFFSYVPILNTYYSDANHLLNALTHSTEAAVIASDALIPFADSLGLKGSGGGSTAEDKASKLVQIMPKILPEVDNLEKKIKQIRAEIDHVEPNRYPEEFQGIKVRSLLQTFKDSLAGVEELTPELKPILSTLPAALGDPNTKTYIIILQNDAELRSTGGFITSVAYITISKGKIVSVDSEDSYRLDDHITDFPPAPHQIKTYLKQDNLTIRDSNLSPDFVESMKIFRDIYSRSSERKKYDGFIALDTEFVRKLLEVTGPVTTKSYNETFSAEPSVNGIPDVVYKLELYSQKLLRETDDRKGLLGDLLNSLLTAVLNTPSDKWQKLIETSIASTQEKHLILYSFDPKAQELLEKYNMAGRIQETEGDYLHINQNNFGGLKSNLFIRENFEQNIEINKNGEVTKTLKIHLNNPAKLDGWLNGFYNDWIRIYVPAGSTLVEGKNVTASSELGKTVFTTFSTLNPQSSTSLTIKYKLPFKVKDSLKMLVQKQPGTKDQGMIIRINNKEVENNPLKGDKEYKFKF